MLKEEAIKEGKKILIEEINKIDDLSITVAFSGGLDSSLIAFLIKNYSKKVNNIELIYTGFKNTHDYFASENSSKILGLNLKKNILTEKKVKEYTKEISNTIKTQDLIEISYLLPTYGVLKKSKNKKVVVGQGADTLFMGFKKFLNDISKSQKLSEKLYKQLEKKLPEREYKLARELNKEIYLPYMSKELSKLILPLDVKYKIDNEKRKKILIEIALELGLNREIAFTEKKSAQYGSGVWKVLKKQNR